MRFFIFLLSATLFFCNTSLAQRLPKEHRIIILLDGSVAMNRPWDGGGTQFAAAKDLAARLIDSIYNTNETVGFSLWTYGNQYLPKDSICADARQEVLFSKDNRTQMSFRLENLFPSGLPGIGYALKQILEKGFTETALYDYSLIIITSGAEGCNDNICSTAALLKDKLWLAPYIICMAPGQPMQQEAACLGNFLTASGEGSVAAAIQTIRLKYPKNRLEIISDSAVARKAMVPVIAGAPAPPVHQQKPVVVNLAPPVIDSPLHYQHSPVVVTDTAQRDTYLLFTSKYPATDINLNYQSGGYFTPVTPSLDIAIPMPEKIKVKVGRYRVYYTIVSGGKPVKRIKEFYARYHADNVVDLD